jgi:hypothetical protein
VGLLLQCGLECSGTVDERSVIEQEGETRGSREHVVGRLRHVHVIVRVDSRVRAARAPQHLRGTVRKHLVRVHVVRRSGAGLIHVYDELIAQPAGEDLVGRVHNRLSNFMLKAAGGRVGRSRCLLDEYGCCDELFRRAQTADGKIFDGALSLDPVVRIRGHGVFAERIALYSNHETTI